MPYSKLASRGAKPADSVEPRLDVRAKRLDLRRQSTDIDQELRDPDLKRPDTPLLPFHHICLRSASRTERRQMIHATD